MGQTESSLLAFRRAAEILDGLAQKHHTDAVVRGRFGGTLHNQATALSKLGRYQEAAESFEAALGHQRYAVAHAAGLRAYREHLVQSLRAYAVLLNQLGQFEKAAKIELELGEIELADQTPRREKTRPRQAADHTLLVPDDESS